tara:strand:- start:163 stop:642 length:480 start_codon:yes stop_codon:yes gene_type:complete
MGKDLNRNEFVATATWNTADGALADNASATSGVWIPEGALITKAYYYVETSMQDDDNGDSQTLALGYTGATGAFVAAIAISDATNVWDAGAHGTLVGMGANLGADAAHDSALEVIALNAATFIQTTADVELLLTTGSERTVDTGKLTVWVHYVQTGKLA